MKTRRLSQADESAVNSVVAILLSSMALTAVVISGVAFQVAQLVQDLPR